MGYGLKGERIPGKIISIRDESDNSLRPVERLVWAVVGIGAMVAGVFVFRARLRGA